MRVRAGRCRLDIPPGCKRFVAVIVQVTHVVCSPAQAGGAEDSTGVHRECPLRVTLCRSRHHESDRNSLKSGHDRLRGQRCRCQSDECPLLYRLCQRTYDSAGPTGVGATLGGLRLPTQTRHCRRDMLGGGAHAIAGASTGCVTPCRRARAADMCTSLVRGVPGEAGGCAAVRQRWHDCLGVVYKGLRRRKHTPHARGPVLASVRRAAGRSPPPAAAWFILRHRQRERSVGREYAARHRTPRRPSSLASSLRLAASHNSAVL